MNKSNHNIDTGKMLDDFLSKKRMAKTDLGQKINRTGVSVIKYIQNSSIQTGILLDICHALKHNFFQDISDLLPADFTISKINTEAGKPLLEKETEINQLKERIKILEAEKAVLLQVFKK